MMDSSSYLVRKYGMCGLICLQISCTLHVLSLPPFQAGLEYCSHPVLCAYSLFRWFAKRFLHPDVVSIYDYIFLWDEDLGVEHFDPGRCVSLNGFCVLIQVSHILYVQLLH